MKLFKEWIKIKTVQKELIKLGVEVPFIRPKLLSKGNINLDQIQKYLLDYLN